MFETLNLTLQFWHSSNALRALCVSYSIEWMHDVYMLKQINVTVRNLKLAVSKMKTWTNSPIGYNPLPHRVSTAINPKVAESHSTLYVYPTPLDAPRAYTRPHTNMAGTKHAWTQTDWNQSALTQIALIQYGSVIKFDCLGKQKAWTPQPFWLNPCLLNAVWRHSF